jgi:hypothetical protein
MRNIIEDLNNNPEESDRLLGIEHQQLTQLIEKAINLHNQKKALAESNKVRIIRGGGGRPPKLTLEAQIINFNLNIFTSFNNISVAGYSV